MATPVPPSDVTVPLGTRFELSYSIGGGGVGALSAIYSLVPAAGGRGPTIMNAILIRATGATLQNDKAFLMINFPGTWTITLMGTSSQSDSPVDLTMMAAPFFVTAVRWLKLDGQPPDSQTFTINIHVLD
jgi:hypothetical protein